MKAILVCDSPRFGDVYPERILDQLAAMTELDRNVYTRQALLDAPVRGSDAALLFSTWGMPSFTREEIERLFPRLRGVFYAAGSVQGFARPFLERGVAVYSAWAANAVPVAEYTVAAILLANKGAFQAMRRFQSGGREQAAAFSSRFPGTYDTTVGFIGLGMIGAMVAERLRAYQVRVLAFDPFCSAQKAERLGVTLCPLETLFAESQTVSNHLANNPQTVGMLRYDLFRRMRPNATFLNTGRGAQVVEEDLVRALAEEPGRTAVLDVTWPEPPASGHAFYTLPNVFLTPHIAGSLGQEVVRMSAYMLEELRAVLDGRPTRYGVTLDMLETMA